MRKLTVTIIALVALVSLHAQTFKPGDVINVDGWICMVISVDNTGEHGKIMSNPSVELTPDQVASIAKSLEESVGDGQSIELDLSEDALLRMGPLPLLTKNKRIDVEVWKQSMPEGWDLPSASDIADFCSVVAGGIGKNNKFSRMDCTMKNPSMSRIFSGGLVFKEDSGKLYSLQVKGAKTCYFEIKDKLTGKECTVAVKSF